MFDLISHPAAHPASHPAAQTSACEPIALGARPTTPDPAAASGDARLDWFAMMLDEIDYGVLLLDGTLRLRHANLAARRELDAQHPITCIGGTLQARAAGEATAFDDALRAAARRGLRRLMLLGEGAQRVAVAVVPLRAPGEAAPCAVQVSLGKRQVCGVLSVQWFARDHGLTNAETRVLEALCGGVPPTEIATRHGVGIATVRSQIGSVRTKTRCGSIGALVRQVAVLPPLVDALRADAFAGEAPRLAA